MRDFFKAGRVIGALALVTALIPAFSHAGTCDSDLSILSRIHSGATEEPAANAHELVVCPTGAGDAYDTRTLEPGANQIQVLYAPNQAPGPNSQSVFATVTGLYANPSLELRPQQVVTGLYRYASVWIGIPAAAHGSVTVTVSGDSTTYHTVN